MPQQYANLRMTVSQAGSLNRILKEMGQLTGMLERIGRSRGPDQAGVKLKNIGRDALKAAAAFAGVGSALQGLHTLASALKNELALIKQHRFVSPAEQQIEVQRILANIRELSPPGSDADQDRLFKLLMEERGNVAPLLGARAMLEARQASQGTGTFAVSRGGLEAAKVFQYFPEEDVLAAARAQQLLVDANTAIGRKTTGEQQAAFLHRALGSSPTSNLKLFSENIGGGAMQLAAAGFQQEQAFATMIGLQKFSADLEGATSRTNLVNTYNRAIEKIAASYPELSDLKGQDVMDFISAQGKFVDDKRAIAMNKRMLGALRRGDLLDDKGAPIGGVGAAEEADQYIRRQGGDVKGLAPGKIQRAEMSARAKGYIALLQLLQPPGEGGRTVTQQFVDQAMKDLPRLEDAPEEFRAARADQKSQVNQATLLADRAVQRASDTFDQASPARGVIGVWMKFNEKVLSKMGLSGIIKRPLRELELMFQGLTVGDMDTPEALDAIIDQATKIRDFKKPVFSKRPNIFAPTAMSGTGVPSPDRYVDALSETDKAIFQALIDELKLLRDAQAAALEQQKAQADGVQKVEVQGVNTPVEPAQSRTDPQEPRSVTNPDTTAPVGGTVWEN